MLQNENDVVVLEKLFNGLFESTENTKLTSGGEEPVYIPAQQQNEHHTIVSTKDYFSSALHEVSHWCVAGARRRKLLDYGYWYEPDGRSEEQQRLFEQVEVKPQALEWIFTQASGNTFRLSVDNVNQPEVKASEGFRKNVHAQVVSYLTYGLPERAKLFLDALLNHFQPMRPYLTHEDFSLEMLQ